MSPELLYPDKFGATDSRPTTQSDCYALGMVVYEVRDHAFALERPELLGVNRSWSEKCRIGISRWATW